MQPACLRNGWVEKANSLGKILGAEGTGIGLKANSAVTLRGEHPVHVTRHTECERRKERGNSSSKTLTTGEGPRFVYVTATAAITDPRIPAGIPVIER